MASISARAAAGSAGCSAPGSGSWPLGASAAPSIGALDRLADAGRVAPRRVAPHHGVGGRPRRRAVGRLATTVTPASWQARRRPVARSRSASAGTGTASTTAPSTGSISSTAPPGPVRRTDVDVVADLHHDADDRVDLAGPSHISSGYSPSGVGARSPAPRPGRRCRRRSPTPSGRRRTLHHVRALAARRHRPRPRAPTSMPPPPPNAEPACTAGTHLDAGRRSCGGTAAGPRSGSSSAVVAGRRSTARLGAVVVVVVRQAR